MSTTYLNDTSFKDEDWDRLLDEIEAQRVIPVVGPELLLMEEDDGQALFYDIVARKLARRLNISSDQLPEVFGLEDVAQSFLAAHGTPGDIYYGIYQIVSAREWPCPKPLEQLAEVARFNLFISTTFDTLLKDALDKVRFGGSDRSYTLAYTDMGAIIDLPVNIDQQRPYIFQLFGQVTASPDFAVTEDDLLRYNHRLQRKDLRPQNLFDQLRSKYLLCLGCSLPNWLTRFFYCATKGDRLFSNLDIRGVVADRATPRDASLAGFLSRRKTQLYRSGDGADFVKALHRRWMDRFGGQAARPVEDPDPAGFLPESVFLSYASQDRAAAVELKKALEAAGIDVWFDKLKLTPGDRYKNKILRNIENCSCFVPVISRNSASSDVRRFFRLEWHKAVEEAQYRPPDFPFVQPVAIDDTAYSSPNIPHEFRECHWQRFEKGRPTDDFIQGIRRLILQIRRHKRMQA